MLTIHKWTLEPTTKIQLPADAQILTIQVQNGTPVLWVLYDTDKPKVWRTFLSYRTGHTIGEEPTRLLYINTFQLEMLVFHVFEFIVALPDYDV